MTKPRAALLAVLSLFVLAGAFVAGNAFLARPADAQFTAYSPFVRSGNAIVPNIATDTIGTSTNRIPAIYATNLDFINAVGTNVTTTNMLLLGTITGNLIPTSTNAYNLGASTSSWKNIYASGTTMLGGEVTIASGTQNGTETRVLDMGTGGVGGGAGGNHAYYQLESNSSTYPWRFNGYGAMFNTTYDNTYNWGWNVDSGGGKIDSNHGEPAWYLQLEANYEPTPGSHWTEFHLNYQSGHSSVTSRPIGAVCIRDTDSCSVGFAGGVSFANTSSTEQLMLYTDGVSNIGPLQFTAGTNHYILFAQNNISPIQQYNAAGTNWYGLIQLNSSDQVVVSPNNRPIVFAESAFPSQNNTYSLGTATSSFRDIYSSSTAYLATIALNGSITPNTNNLVNAGTSAKAFADMNASGTAYLANVSSNAVTAKSVTTTSLIADAAGGGTLTVDATNHRVGILTNSPNYSFEARVNSFAIDAGGNGQQLVQLSGTAFSWELLGTNTEMDFNMALKPRMNNLSALGGFGQAWSNIYASSTVYATAPTNSILTGNGTASLAAIGPAASPATGLFFNSGGNNDLSITTGGSTKMDFFGSNITVTNADFVAGDSHSLGTLSAPWLNGFFSGTVSATHATLSNLVSNGTGDNYICVTSQGVLQQSTLCSLSSIRFKEHVAALSPDELMARERKLRPVTFDWKDGKHSLYGTTQDEGFIAEEVAMIDPYLVAWQMTTSTEDVALVRKAYPDLVLPTRDGQTMIPKTVDYARISVIETGAILYTDARIDALKARDSDQEARIKRLETAASKPSASNGAAALAVVAILAVGVLAFCLWPRKSDEKL